MSNKGKEKAQEKPSQKRSVWDCFTKVELPDGSKKAKCNNCEKLLSGDSKIHGTSHLRRHCKSCGGTEPRNKDARTTIPSYSSGNRVNHLGYSQQTNTDPSGCQDNNLGENHLRYVQQINTEPTGNKDNQLEYLQQTNVEPSGCQENHLEYVQPINTEPFGNRENQLGYVQQTNIEPSGCQDNNLGENNLGYVQQINTKPYGNGENQLRYLQQIDTEPSGSQENSLGENHLGHVQKLNTEPSGCQKNHLEYDPQKNRELFVKMVIDNKNMLEHVENPFLQEFARFLQPSYSHVTRRDVEEDCLAFYKKEKAQLKEKITKLTSKVSLSMAPFYNPKDGSPHCCVAAHFIDNDFKLFKRIIGFVELDDLRLIKEFDYERVLNDWGLCNKVCAWSKTYYSWRKEKFSPTYVVRSILESFHSIAYHIYFAIESDVDYIRGTMNDLNEFPEKMCYFNEIAAQHNLAPKFEFVLSNEGILGFDLNILNEACTYKNVLCAFVGTNVGWSKVEEVVPLLNKINDVVVMLFSLEFPTSNLLLKFVFEISDILSEASPVLSGGIKDAIEKSLEQLDEYLESCNYILLIASLLDPRFKLRFHKRCIGKFIAKEEDFDKSFCSLYNKYQSESTEINIFDRLSQIPELKKYLKGPVEEKKYLKGPVNFDVLGWWKDNELVYPILSRMARDILAIPASISLTSETEFVKDIIKEIFDSTVDTEMSKVLVYCNNWLRASRTTGNYVAGIENIVERRHLDQAFYEHSNRSNSCVYDQIECQELLAKLVISCELPFHFVKSTWFIEWAKNLQPLFTPVDLASIKTNCLGFYQIERQMLTNIHKKTFVNSAHLKRVCFSVHVVESRDPTCYVCVTTHFIDNDFKLFRRTIGIQIITFEDYWNYEEIIALHVQRCIDNWACSKKVLAFTTKTIDDVESPKEILDGLTRGIGAIKLHCFVQELTSRLLRILRYKLDRVFETIRKMIKFFAKDPKAMHTINDLASKINSPKLYLQLDDKRRWDSTLNMLSDALAYKDVFYTYKGVDESFPLCKNWDAVESAVKLLKPIYEAVTILSSSQYPTSNLFLKVFFEIHDVLSHVVFNTNNDYDKGKFLDCLMETSSNYLKDCNNILLVASLLDPRFKSNYLERCYTEHISDREEIKKCIGDLCIMFQIEHDLGISELGRYLQEDRVEVRDDDFDVLTWWKDNQSNYPILSIIARHILAIPVSSKPVESYFPISSFLGCYRKYACQLGPKTLEALVCSNSWLSAASSNGKCVRKGADIDLVKKHIPSSYKCPLRVCDLWSINFLKHGLTDERMSEEIVAIRDARLTANNMQCLIQPIGEDGRDNWIPDEVINCYIGIMNNQGSTSGNILKLTTFHSQQLQSWGLYPGRILPSISEMGRSFLQKELVFLPINVDNKHWFVGVLNASKKEFQILNSLNSCGGPYEETTHKLRLGIERCIDAAFDSLGIVDAWRPPDMKVVNWPIIVISNLPQQEDGCSCGLFALKYMQLWNGSKLASEFTKDDIDLFRKQLVGELIFSDLNEKKDIQDEIKKSVMNIIVEGPFYSLA